MQQMNRKLAAAREVLAQKKTASSPDAANGMEKMMYMG